MMLRKRSRPAQKDHGSGQPMTDSASDSTFSSDAVRKPRNTSFFSLPGLFVGFAKGVTDSEPARSPISPLDYRVFSSLGSHFARSPRSPGVDGPRKSWECDRVGLGLVDSLNDGCKPCGNLLGSSESRNILLGSQMKISIPNPKTHLDHLLPEGSATSPKSLPKNYVISSHARAASLLHRYGSSETAPALPGAHPGPGKIQSCSDMGRSPLARQNLSSEAIRSEPRNDSLVSSFARGVDFRSSSGSLPITRGFLGSLPLSASDIEQSEDYTCIISHGPNPKTTHIFGDCILESHTGDLSDFVSNNKKGEEAKLSSWMVKCAEEDTMPFPSEDFLSVCYSCKRKLEGKDIYMYRGEKAFCSCGCRSQEIMDEEEMEEPATDSSGSPRSSCSEEIFLPGVIVAK